MLKSINEWNEYLDKVPACVQLKDQFNKDAEKFKFHVFYEHKNYERLNKARKYFKWMKKTIHI